MGKRGQEGTNEGTSRGRGGKLKVEEVRKCSFTK